MSLLIASGCRAWVHVFRFSLVVEYRLNESKRESLMKVTCNYLQHLTFSKKGNILITTSLLSLGRMWSGCRQSLVCQFWWRVLWLLRIVSIWMLCSSLKYFSLIEEFLFDIFLYLISILCWLYAARIAIQVGAAGIIVSNHGARQLDYVPATISCLEEVHCLVIYITKGAFFFTGKLTWTWIVISSRRLFLKCLASCFT